jgi:hypothetical protein
MESLEITSSKDEKYFYQQINIINEEKKLSTGNLSPNGEKKWMNLGATLRTKELLVGRRNISKLIIKKCGAMVTHPNRQKGYTNKIKVGDS